MPRGVPPCKRTLAKLVPGEAGGPAAAVTAHGRIGAGCVAAGGAHHLLMSNGFLVDELDVTLERAIGGSTAGVGRVVGGRLATGSVLVPSRIRVRVSGEVSQGAPVLIAGG
jgi:hypothetical protein